MGKNIENNSVCCLPITDFHSNSEYNKQLSLSIIVGGHGLFGLFSFLGLKNNIGYQQTKGVFIYIGNHCDCGCSELYFESVNSIKKEKPFKVSLFHIPNIA